MLWQCVVLHAGGSGVRQMGFVFGSVYQLCDQDKLLNAAKPPFLHL